MRGTTQLPRTVFVKFLSKGFSWNFVRPTNFREILYVQRLFVKFCTSNGFSWNFCTSNDFSWNFCTSNGFSWNFVRPTAFREIFVRPPAFRENFVRPTAFPEFLYVQRIFVKFYMYNGFSWNFIRPTFRKILYVQKFRVRFQSDTGMGILQEDLGTFMVISRRVLSVLREG